MQTMTVKVEQNELRIDVESLIASLPEEGRTKIAKLIGADLHAWRQMAEAVASEDNHYNGDEGWWFDGASMLEVRAKLKPLMSDVARYALEELQQQLDTAKSGKERAERWAWAMYHAHNGISGARWPDLPDWAPAAREEMRVRDAAPGMREALRAVEWNGGAAGGWCPGCERHSSDGHEPDCKLAAALRAADREGTK